MVNYKLFICLCVFLYTLCMSNSGEARVWNGHRIIDHPAPNMCALTFDDGPSHLSPQFLDALKEENVKATFFVLGMQAESYPYMITRMINEGHEVANHSYDHADLKVLSPNAIYANLKKTNKVLNKLGVKPRFLRPPYGSYDKEVINQAQKLGMSVVLWTVDSRDWESAPDYSNMQNILNRPMSKDEMRGIFLFHDTKKRTVRDIKLIITILRTMGCDKFVKVSQYLNVESEVELFDYETPLMVTKPDLSKLASDNANNYSKFYFDWNANVLPKKSYDKSVLKNKSEVKEYPSTSDYNK